MPKPYSLDLRKRINAAWQGSEGSQAQVAVRFGVSERCVHGLVRRPRESGSVAAKMDNLGAHKVKGVKELLEAAGARLLCLPPYSADFNPIELAWSKLEKLSA